MIRLLTAGDSLPPLPAQEAAVKLAGWWTAYGPDRSFVRFWTTEQGGLLGCMGDVALAAVPPADHEEAALFLCMQPDLRLVRSDPAFMGALSAQRGGQTETGMVMRLEGEIPSVEPAEAPSLRQAYALLRQVFGDTMPPFDTWYVDMSHRLRHGCGQMAGITVGDTLAAVAMTTAESPAAGLIGGVATHPDHRGQGYAHRCVMTLASSLRRQGKEVWLSPKNDYAQALYTRWGFIPAGEWAQMMV